MNPSQRRYQARKKQERALAFIDGIQVLKDGLIAEGSTTAQRIYGNIRVMLNRRITNGRFRNVDGLAKGMTMYERGAMVYWTYHIGELVDKAIASTDTYREARKKLFKLIGQIVLEHQEEVA